MAHEVHEVTEWPHSSVRRPIHLELTFAALLLIFPTIADAMPLAGGPPLPPLPGDDAGGDDLDIKGATLFGRENN